MMLSKACERIFEADWPGTQNARRAHSGYNRGSMGAQWPRTTEHTDPLGTHSHDSNGIHWKHNQ
eukprot:9971678-Alexandrium_andersonii.AAC.1